MYFLFLYLSQKLGIINTPFHSKKSAWKQTLHNNTIVIPIPYSNHPIYQNNMCNIQMVKVYKKFIWFALNYQIQSTGQWWSTLRNIMR